MSAAELFVLGVPKVHLNGHNVHLRTNKTMALLVYLALEPGPHARDELAELLWPACPNTARSSLRFELHHLHAALGGTVSMVVTRHDIELLRDGKLWVDALAMAALGRASLELPLREAQVLGRGEFLQGFSVKSSSSWDEWAGIQASQWAIQVDDFLAHQVTVRIKAGQLGSAATLALQRITLDPYNESAYHQVGDVYLAAGHTRAAEETRRMYWKVIHQDLGVEVTPPIAQGAEPGRPAPPLPLIRRESLLKQMNDAWDAGQMVFLAGESGAGKSRLAAEFAARYSYERFTMVAQATDAGVPFAAQSRNIRTCLDFLGHPHLSSTMRRCLGAIVPELWDGAHVRLHRSDDRQHLFDAFTAFLGVVRKLRPNYCLVNENLHYWDRESYAMAAYAAIHGHPLRIFQQVIATYRPEVLSRDMYQEIQKVVREGRACVLNIPPFTVEEVHDLLAQIEHRATAQLAARLHKFTGGNPLFVVETVRLLQQRGGLSQPEYGELPCPPRVQQVIAARIQHLTSGARDVLQVAALVGAEFSVTLAAYVLSEPPLKVAHHMDQLEAAGLFRNAQMAHDAVETVTRELIPMHTRVAVHRRLLEVFGSVTTPAVNLAHHALEADQWADAYALFMQVSRDARALLTRREAIDFAEQAAALLQNISDLYGAVENQNSGLSSVTY